MIDRKVVHLLVGAMCAGAVLFLSQSCDNNYDKEISKEVTVGKGLSIPIGKTDSIKLSRLLETDDVLTTIGDQYAISKKDKVEANVPAIDGVAIDYENPDIEPIEFEFKGNKDIADVRLDEQSSVIDMATELGELTVAPQQIDQRDNIDVGSSTIPSGVLPLFVSGQADVEFSFSIPSQVKKLQQVNFGKDAKGDLITFSFEANKLADLDNYNASISSFTATFPTGTVLTTAGEGSVSGTVFSANNITIDKDGQLKVSVYLKSLKGNFENGKYNDKILYTAHLSISSNGGSISGGNGPAFHTSANLVFRNADVIINEIHSDLAEANININANVEGIPQDIKTINDVMFKESYLTLKMEDPQLAANYNVDNLVITFPDRYTFSPALPGNQLKITLSELINGHKLKLAKVDLSRETINDNRVIVLRDQVTTSPSTIVFHADQVVNSTVLDDIRNKNIKFLVPATMFEVSDVDVIFGTLSADIENITKANVHQSVPNDLVRIDRVHLKRPVLARLKLDIPNWPAGLQDVFFRKMKISFPKVLEFEADKDIDKNNVLTIDNQSFSKNRPFEKVLTIKSLVNVPLKKEGNEQFVDINEDIVVKGELYSNDVQASSGMGTINFRPVFDITDKLEIASIDGGVDPEINIDPQDIDLGSIPDFLKKPNTNLDVQNIVLDLNVDNPVEVPIATNITLQSIDESGNPMLTKPISIPIIIQPADASGNVITKILVTNKKHDVVSDGYQEVVVDNLTDLLNRVPTSIKLVAENTHAVQKDEASQNYVHKIALEKEYKMSIDYDIRVPFEFGDKLHIEYTDSISDLQSDLEDIIDGIRSLEVIGEADNSVPLNLELNIVPCDTDGKELEGVLVNGPFHVAAGNMDGSIKTSNLDIRIKESKEGALSKLDKLMLVIKGNSGHTEGAVALKPEQFVQVRMKARVPEGVTVTIE